MRKVNIYKIEKKKVQTQTQTQTIKNKYFNK
jgi:hypothetical protein